MAPSDFSLSQSGMSRNLLMDRSLMIPTHLSMDRDTECNDTELKLLYDEYLRNIMTEIILQKKTEETEKLLLSQLATIAKEVEHNEEKLFKLKTREIDIINLTKLQNDLDSQIERSKSIGNKDIKQLEDILSLLHSLLQCFDILPCSNIVLPETSNQWEETIKALKSCGDTLKSITDMTETTNDSYQRINNGIKDFSNTYSTTQNHYERLGKEICELQALVLKTTSLSLARNRD
ncbi:uncharacterized protein LOC143148645 isoform X2 [Ptiloglossa arizonensis]